MITIVLLTLILFISGIKGQFCDQPIGLSDGRIADSQFTASSYKNWHYPHRARLNQNKGAGAWCAKNRDSKPWIKIDLNGTYYITNIQVQGRNSSYNGWYVTRFVVKYERLGSLIYDTRNFESTKDKNSVATLNLDLTTSVIMIKPTDWHPKTQGPCMRLELIGCKANPLDFCATNNTCEHLCSNGITRAICSCLPGFELANDRKSCIDINECRKGVDRCDIYTTRCVNKPGTYQCECLDNSLEKGISDYKCSDKNECTTNNGGCHHKCSNKQPYYQCSCYDGYTLSSDNHTCIDNNECTNGTHLCNLMTTTCHNVPGSYSCKCLSGLKHYDQHNCLDINECDTQNGGCDQTCTNDYRSYKCSCRNGTILASDQHKCDDINECTTTSHNCSQTCRNYYGGYSCDCYKGYRLNRDGITCEDIDECRTNSGKGQCEYKCTNSKGSYKCSCPKGFKLGNDGKSCTDIDECAKHTDNCDTNTSSCVNIHGSFQCRCITGYEKDLKSGLCKAKKCLKLQPSLNGFIHPPDCMKADTKKYNDVCSFKCNQGYELNKKSAKTAFCNSDGNWDLRGGYQAICQKIRCGKVSDVAGASLVPSLCSTVGAEYGGHCKLSCNNGFYKQGKDLIKCLINGSYDGDFKDSKCLPRKKLECPSDVKIILPFGASNMSLPLTKLNIKLDLDDLNTVPAGVLTGKYKFTSRHQSQPVKLVPKLNTYIEDSCTFLVTIQDRELPKVENCPPKDLYFTVQGASGVVEWPEPKFSDNVGINKVIQNIKNKGVLPQQVYFVYYAATDNYGNEMTCRFFVHVKARHCSKLEIPGGDGNSKEIWFPSGNNQLSVFLTCPAGKTFSTNITGAPIFRCNKGTWQNVPDCVDSIAMNDSCPIGYNTIKDSTTLQLKCGKCPKGTHYSNISKKCTDCPVGQYQDDQGSMVCKHCPNGMITLKGGRKRLADCQAKCPPGGYSSTGLYGSSGCARCPEGSYQDLYGQQSCKLCLGGGVTFVGAKSENECSLPARVSKILPETETINAYVGDTIQIKCYGTGSPAPFMHITNNTVLPPDSFRGKALQQPLPTGNKYISGLQLTISNVQVYDTAVYKCSADNKMGSLGGYDEREIVIEVSRR